ncbi:DNA (cytosine-5-)-methyltransferase [uncultured Sphaerochaeta sp.]|uniref:DNA (cytosine-5-)-methyltransferase n=1 Tax=uncultured Sphaerochaeta sp. TaxID=886478 RepID=UPI002AA8F09A|nr:DNA (cytosine-5-)-methyltransferase [uncultured Sphaerochaeta sp.]
MSNKKKYSVVELFAGVGGFRVGLEAAGKWDVVFANQWEPGKKNQWAFDCYTSHFTTGIHSNEDIAQVKAEDIPNHTLLVGGFPCQDYSVAATLAKGIQGKKGILWWEIRRIIEAKEPQFILLENVDRLIKSPANQRGRDFAIILSCLNALGYVVEWRVINAADYGFPQRRRRTFIFASKTNEKVSSLYTSDAESVLLKKGFFAQAFPVEQDKSLHQIDIPEDLVEITNEFSTLFSNSGFSYNFRCFHLHTVPVSVKDGLTLGDILDEVVDESFYLDDQDLEKWKYMKGSKREVRKTRDGFEYNYTEGAIPFPEFLDRPSRTMLTSESTKNRSTHVIRDPHTNRLRLLTPQECEKLDGFEPGWTATGMPRRMRYFCMGNALVVGLIEKMGLMLLKYGKDFKLL